MISSIVKGISWRERLEISYTKWLDVSWVAVLAHVHAVERPSERLDAYNTEHGEHQYEHQQSEQTGEERSLLTTIVSTAIVAFGTAVGNFRWTRVVRIVDSSKLWVLGIDLVHALHRQCFSRYLQVSVPVVRARAKHNRPRRIVDDMSSGPECKITSGGSEYSRPEQRRPLDGSNFGEFPCESRRCG